MAKPIAAAGAANLTAVSLELGGKGADLVFDDGGPGPRLTRTVYSVTPKGHAELAAWLGVAHDAAPPRDPFMVQALNFDMIPAAEEAEAHRDRLVRMDTALLKERLTRRDPEDHDGIARLKAHVFDGMVRVRVEWAREGQRLLGS